MNKSTPRVVRDGFAGKLQVTGVLDKIRAEQQVKLDEVAGLGVAVPTDIQLDDGDKKEKDESDESDWDDDNDEDEDDDEDEEGDGGAGGSGKSRKKKKKKNEEPLVTMPPDVCGSTNRCPHYAHKDCLDALLERTPNPRTGAAVSASEEPPVCPRCDDLLRRIQMDGDGQNRVCTNIAAVPGAEPGFVLSSKLAKAIEWVQYWQAQGDKVIVLSFFKAGLDLLEGHLHHDLYDTLGVQGGTGLHHISFSMNLN